ncbi:conserved hypothetical membrane protein [Halorhabdus tiamatea SARL4B]|uniref:Conserved hypothetical membrane protein n=1 Tax=Halorhabdus tiamatea SARL4B TaxID=1033806 RepID=S6CTV0_9EURY|nr:conserved hypothetical membrane protein [Halorhabdus tiamatea SARL4B]
MVGSLANRRLDLPALCLGSVVIDVRAALVIFGPLEPPIHGPLTTLLGGALVAVAVAIAVLAGYELASPSIERYGLDLRWSRSSIAAGALVGTWSHVVLDAILYIDARPLAPLSANPLLGLLSPAIVYAGCVLAGAAGAGLLWLRATGAWKSVRT